jgi:rod shape-determining protein MreD
MVERHGSRLGLIITLLGLGFLYFSLGPVWESWFVSPNLLVCAVLVLARQLRPGTAAGVGFGLGLLEDSMAVSHFGLATLLLVLFAYAGSRTRDLFVGEETLFMGTYLFAGTWLYETISFAFAGTGSDLLLFALTRAPLDALATGAVGYLVLPIVRAR